MAEHPNLKKWQDLASKQMKGKPVESLNWKTPEGITVEPLYTAEEIAEILRTRHRTPIGVDDFSVFSQQDFLDTASAITGVLTIFLGGIAAISLLVGGIGIMNIMLVSVTERTREIGIRIALGADSGSVSRLVVRQGIGVIVGGIALGLVQNHHIAGFGHLQSGIGRGILAEMPVSDAVDCGACAVQQRAVIQRMRRPGNS